MTYVEAAHDFCCSDQSFLVVVVVVETQLISLKVLLNFTKKLSRFTNIREFFFKRRKNHNNTALKSKVPMNSTCDSKVGYL